MTTSVLIANEGTNTDKQNKEGRTNQEETIQQTNNKQTNKQKETTRQTNKPTNQHKQTDKQRETTTEANLKQTKQNKAVDIIWFKRKQVDIKCSHVYRQTDARR